MTELFICNRCGNVIAEGELDCRPEILDVIDGSPYAEAHTCCPVCFSFDIISTDI